MEAEVAAALRANDAFTPSQTGPILFQLRHISFCAFDPHEFRCARDRFFMRRRIASRLFGFTSRQPNGTDFACHVFQFDRSAAPIANAVAFADSPRPAYLTPAFRRAFKAYSDDK